MWERLSRKPDRRLPVTYLALALIAMGLVLVLRPTRAPYLDLLRQGDEHAARTERTAAVAAYREAARLRPDDPAPYLRLARVYLDWGRTKEALARLAEAERRGAEQTDGTGLGWLWVAVHTARADWPAVVEDAQRLLASAPATVDSAVVRHTLARAYVELQEWDAARAEYEALLRVDPADALAHERLGALILGEDPIAVAHLSAAGTELADRLLAVLWEAEAVVSADDDRAYASARVGRVLLEEQEWALAARQFERALFHNPDYPDAHAYLGHALDQMGRMDEARPHLQRAVALAPDSPVAHTFLGLHYDRLGHVSAARAAYEAAYDLDPDNPGTCAEIGQTWAAEGRYVAAEVWMRQAVSLRPHDPALWEVLARLYVDHNITTDGRGVDAAEKLVELSPGDAEAHDLRGWAAFQAGDYAAAHDSLLQAIVLDPTLAAAHYHLGRLWAAEGAHQEAREAFIRALDLDTTGALVPLVERAMGEISYES